MPPTGQSQDPNQFNQPGQESGQSFQPNVWQASPTAQQPPAVTPQVPLDPNSYHTESASYDFILNSPKHSRPSLFKTNSSFATRLLVFAGGALLLVIVIILISNLFGGGTDFSGFAGVAEDQQELIHISTDASNTSVQSLPPVLLNTVATINLSVGSAQTQILSYLKSNHYSVSTKTLSLKISSSLDSQLTSSATSGTYSQELSSALTSELNTYINDLNNTYVKFSGPKGRALLVSDYKQAELILKQLNSANSNS